MKKGTGRAAGDIYGRRGLPEQRQIKTEKDRIYFDDVKDLMFNTVFHNQIHPAARRKGIAGTGQKICRLVQVQFQRNRKRQHRLFPGTVLRIAPDFGKELPVDIGLFINLRIRQAPFIDQTEQPFLKGLAHLPHNILQIIGQDSFFRSRRQAAGLPGHGQGHVLVNPFLPAAAQTFP